jgi:hypothetical protein
MKGVLYLGCCSFRSLVKSRRFSETQIHFLSLVPALFPVTARGAACHKCQFADDVKSD